LLSGGLGNRNLGLADIKILVHNLGRESAGEKQDVQGLSRHKKKKLMMKPYNFIKFLLRKVAEGIIRLTSRVVCSHDAAP
jgi:hypothetical protein